MEQLRAAAYDAVPLLVDTRQVAGHVDEHHDRYAVRIAHPHEAAPFSALAESRQPPRRIGCWPVRRRCGPASRPSVVVRFGAQPACSSAAVPSSRNAATTGFTS
jgi:hypothetical protein